jgi:hypothetical protein
VKTEPLSPKTDEYDFAYASDIVENKGRDPGVRNRMLVSLRGGGGEFGNLKP